MECEKNIDVPMYNGYNIINPCGRGASGYVYEVEKDEVKYALKECIDVDEISVKRFNREIRIAKALSHPNIIRVIESHFDSIPPYFIMELCEGDLSKFVPYINNIEDRVTVVRQVCEGIKALHQASIIHRDIKPGNVLMYKGIAKVTDFSFGFFTNHDSTTLTRSDQSIGTPGYIAPEISTVGGHHATILSDIYSLGCTIFYILSGGCHPEHYNPASIPVSFVHLIEKCRNIDPNQRYNSVQNIIDELDAITTIPNFLTIEEVIANRQNLSKIDFCKNAYELLLREERWPELISDITRLKPYRILLLRTIPSSGENILLLLDNIFKLDTISWKQFEDIDPFTDFCYDVFMNTESILVKQKAISLSLPFAVDNTRYHAMDLVSDMLSHLSSADVRSICGYLIEVKDLLEKLIAEGRSVPQSVRIVTRIN